MGAPAWSPDGTRVVFMIREEDRSERLYVASLEDDGFSEPTPLPDVIRAYLGGEAAPA